ncbi:tail fiber protein [Luteolibacter marinus]|uniref:tail fiber protein n=1 Tax=Luteolibacter marinus TaxID=2776705 RepID=UPI0018685017|nr:tail fiber protein [Luteolibacter marinus]
MTGLHLPSLALIVLGTVSAIAIAQETGVTGGAAPVPLTQPTLTLRPILVTAGTYPDLSGGTPTATGSGPSYVGEIRWFAGDYPFNDEAIDADGRLISIASNTALFSLLGTTYGGDGKTTFGIPDLRSRVAVGTGTGPGLDDMPLGLKAGEETTVLGTTELTGHSHLVGGELTGAAGSGTGRSSRQPGLSLQPLIRGDGEIRFFGFSIQYPTGWARCDGQIFATGDAPDLNSRIGTTYGGGGGQFAVPDLRGRAALGIGTGSGLTPRALGQTAGSRYLPFGQRQLPPHVHDLPGAGSTGASGSGTPLELLQPSLGIQWAICTSGSFPGAHTNPFLGGAAVVGELRPYASSILPAGFAPADGSIVLINSNAVLFSILGTRYGGNGVTTFALPDLRGRVAAGQGPGINLTPRNLAEPFGTERITLTESQMPAHSHSLALTPPIPNPSFELDAFSNYPGYVQNNGDAITGWMTSNNSGLNPAGGSSPFANSGIIPDGSQVALLQSSAGSAATMSTTISGLTAGNSYTVRFRANARDYQDGIPQAAWSVNGHPFAAIDVWPFVGSGNAYYPVSGVFTATGPTAVLALRNSAPGDTTLLIDDFRLSNEAGAPWSVTPWTGDASSGIDPDRTLWAYNLGSSTSTTVNGVAVTAIPTINPAATGNFSSTGFIATAADSNDLTAGGTGSNNIAQGFTYGGNPGSITFESLIPGRTYTAGFLGTGYDVSAARTATLAGQRDHITFDENRYGNNKGLLARYRFTADADTHAVTFTPADGASTFHLYGLTLADDGITTFDGWRIAEFGAEAGNSAIAGPFANPETDPYLNLLDYAFLLDPHAPDASIFGPAEVDGADRRFSIPLRAAATDLTYKLQRSTTLGGWQSVFAYRPDRGTIEADPGISGAIDPSSGRLEITVTGSSLFLPLSFWRVAVTLDGWPD